MTVAGVQLDARYFTETEILVHEELEVKCSTCDAKPGVACRSLNKNNKPAPMSHKARRNAFARSKRRVLDSK